MSGSIRAVERVDRFLSGLLERIGPRSLVLVTSDHGNVEDTRGGHTRNPALTLLVGPGAHSRARDLRSIMDVPEAILGWLGPIDGS
jgi:phosphopentomutase